MTFEQTMHTIYGIFNKRVGNFGNYEVNRFYREIETSLKALQAEYDRQLAINKVLEKKAERLESLLNTEMELGNRLAQYRDNAHAEKEALQDEYNRLLQENNQLKKEKAGWDLWGTPYDSSKGMPKAPKNTEWKR